MVAAEGCLERVVGGGGQEPRDVKGGRAMKGPGNEGAGQ